MNRKSREGSTLFVEFPSAPALKADSKEGEKTEAYEEDTEHENPAPMGVNPR